MICHSNSEYFAESHPTGDYPLKGWLGMALQARANVTNLNARGK